MEPCIRYTTSCSVPWRPIQALFRRNLWREWFSDEDTQYLLANALLPAAAWDGDTAVGICVLWGDGRFYCRIDTLLVDESYRRRGIGTALVKLVMDQVDKLRPHYCELDTHEWLVAFYGKFGFEVSHGPWMVHKPTGDHLFEYAEHQRARLRAMTSEAG